MAIVGRKKEIEIMDQLLRSNDSEFLAVYGRRRVGKTYLIREKFGKSIVFECTGLLDAGLKAQLQNFWIELGRVYTSAARKPVPESWLEAFQFLQKYIDRISSRRRKKMVIFLMRYPGMIHPDQALWLHFRSSGIRIAVKEKMYCL